MTDLALEQLREHFGVDDYALRIKLEKMFSNVNRTDSVPYTTIQALEVLVSRLLDDELERPIAVVEGIYSTSRLPDKKSGKGKNRNGIYNFYLGGKWLTLGKHPLKRNYTEKKNFKVGISWDFESNIGVVVDDSYEQSKIQMQRSGHVYSNGVKDIELFDFSRIWPEKFNVSTGVAIKKTNQKGEFKIGDNNFNLGVDNSNNYIFLFFRNGLTYFFNHEGKKLTRALSVKQQFAEQIDEKVMKIMKQYNSCDLKELSRRSMNYMVHMWETKPSRFSPRFGRRLLINGSYSAPVGKGSHIKIRHYEGDRKKQYIFVGRAHDGKPVEISWQGHYLIIKDKNKQVLNAHALSTPGIEMLKPHTIDTLQEAITIRDLDEKLRAELAVNGIKYRFCRPQIREYLSGYQPNIRKAILAHTFSDERMNSFYLLVDNGINIQRYPLLCHSATIRN
ncbi:hypothetical protein HOC35_07150 [Candidatus Woesearchaeota archaeon]|jgi:hypothetical protein|nr:hypothetical protein [Candidatus Woesearchaeota archaeon]